MSEDINELYQQVILDHSRSPLNYHALPDPSRTAQGRNPICGDQVTVYVKMDGDVIADIGFQGSGCAISKAAASIMTASLKGKTVAEARVMFDQFRQVVTTGEGDLDEMGKLAAFAGVHKFPGRVKCAILPWHAIMSALERQISPETVSTE